MKTKFAIFLASCFLLLQPACVTGLWVPSPKPVVDEIWAIDSSTPTEYNAHQGGFLGFVGDKGLITSGLRLKYNALISLYKEQFFEVKAVELSKDDGIEKYTDEHGNELFLIDEEHLVYFIILKKWSNELRPPDK